MENVVKTVGEEMKLERGDRLALGEITNKANTGAVGRQRRKAGNEAVKRIVNVKKRRTKEETNSVINEQVEVTKLKDSGRHSSIGRYSADIYEYLLSLEQRYLLKPDHLAQCNITDRMRQIVVDWLLEVQIHFKLDQETLELTISVLDRFMAAEPEVDRKNIQLITLAALFVAIKYQETFLLELSDLRFICDYSFTEEEILDMERRVLSAIEFNLSYPSKTSFLCRLLATIDCDERLAFYLVDLSLLDSCLASVAPSKVASACIYISLCIAAASPLPWSGTLTLLTTYSLLDLKHSILALSRRCASSIDVSKGGIFTKHLKPDGRIADIVRSRPCRETLSQICSLMDSELDTNPLL